MYPRDGGELALPLLHERITSFETPLTKATTQLRQVCEALDQRALSLWGSEYGCARFVKLTADIPCDKLMRIKSNRVLYGPPPPYSGRGRPRKHGDKFKLNAPDTWWQPQQQQDIQDETLGRVRLRCWTQLHFYQSAEVPMRLILVERLDETGKRTHRPLWLIATGDALPPLEALWSLYLRRFCVDHWYRFHQTTFTLVFAPFWELLNKLLSGVILMPLMSWQLWMARNESQANPLPWQKPLKHKTPGRVADAFAPILANVGTPAEAPQPRGKSPGWPTGKIRTPRKRFPTVKKSYSKPKSKSNAAA